MLRLLSIAAALAAMAVAVPAAQAVAAPTIVSTWAENATESAATLRAEVNPNGVSTDYRFEYTTEAAFLLGGFGGAARIPAPDLNLGAGVVPVSLSKRPTGLQPATAYTYRIVVTSGSEVVEGPIRSLTTVQAGGGEGSAGPTQIPCLGDACQPLPPEPEDPTPGTVRIKPSGNYPPPSTKPRQPCRAGQVKKKGKCVKKKKKTHKKKTHKKRGGGK